MQSGSRCSSRAGSGRGWRTSARSRTGRGCRLCIRPERIELGNGGEPAVIDDVVFVGAFTRYLVLTDNGERLTVVQQSDGRTLGRGERVGIAWRDEDAFQLPGEGR